MKNPSLVAVFLLGALVLGLIRPAARPATAQAPTPIAVIVAANFRESDISLALLRRIFRGEPTEYGGARLVPFNYAPDNPTRLAFDASALNMTSEQAASYWVDRRIRGQGMSPRIVPAPLIMKAIVAKLPGGIGYMPADQVDASVRALTVDGKAAKGADYPIK